MKNIYELDLENNKIHKCIYQTLKYFRSGQQLVIRQKSLILFNANVRLRIGRILLVGISGTARFADVLNANALRRGNFFDQTF
jgi:hypothetical protein